MFITATSIRSKIVKLRTKFPTLDEAEQSFDINIDTYAGGDNMKTDGRSFQQQFVRFCEESEPLPTSKLIARCIALLPLRQKLDLLDEVFNEVAQGSDLGDCPGYLSQSLSAMVKLRLANKTNLLQKFAKCISEERKDGSGQSLMPLNQMPFGLIDYNIQFFSSETSTKQVSFCN